MKLKVKKGIAVGVLSGILALVGCAPQSVDTEGFEARLAEVQGVNGALVEVQHPGLPTNTNVAVWLFVDSPDIDSVVAITRDVADAAATDDGVRGQQVNLSVVQGDPADFPTRQSAVKNSLPVMHLVAEALGLPDSAGEMLVLSPKEISDLAGADD